MRDRHRRRRLPCDDRLDDRDEPPFSYALRAILEPVALETAADHISAQELTRMTGSLRAAILDAPSAVRLDELERDLHFNLIGRCTNGMLRQTMFQTQSLLLAHRLFYRFTAEMYPVEPFLSEHLAVLEYLGKGILSKAQSALRAHLMASSARAVERIANVRGLVRLDTIGFLDPIEREAFSNSTIIAPRLKLGSLVHCLSAAPPMRKAMNVSQVKDGTL